MRTSVCWIGPSCGHFHFCCCVVFAVVPGGVFAGAWATCSEIFKVSVVSFYLLLPCGKGCVDNERSRNKGLGDILVKKKITNIKFYMSNVIVDFEEQIN